jgi:hypothetical protein
VQSADRLPGALRQLPVRGKESPIDVSNQQPDGRQGRATDGHCIINRHGGRIPETWGVPFEEIQRGIRHGVRKVNVDTDCRLAFTGAVRKFLAESPESFDPREYLGAARDAVRRESMRHMRTFGQAGHAGEYAAIPLEEMAARYHQPDSAAP